MSKESLVTSVRQRLNRIAREKDLDFNSVQLRYVQERFLYRISKSTYRNAFILKGALLFLAYNIPSLRPTKDIDFLGVDLTEDAEELREIIKKICEVKAEDAVEFDSASIETENITIERQYPGFRIKLIAYIGTARVTLRLDLGYGDIVIPEPVEIEFPKLLDFESPKIKTYSLESAIAEKLEACVKLNFNTSRMKDFYDIYKLAAHNTFNSFELKNAIKETFNIRGTELNNKELIFSNKFKSDKTKETQWKAFLNRTGLSVNYNHSEIVDKLSVFIEGSLSVKHDNKTWNFESWEWE